MAIGYAVMNSSNSDSCVGYEEPGVEIPFEEQPIGYRDLCEKEKDDKGNELNKCKPISKNVVRYVDES